MRINIFPFDARAAVRNAPKQAYVTDDNPRESFIDEMRSYGFQPPSLPVLGKIDRIPAPNEKPGKKSGWYIYNEIQDDYKPGSWIGIGVFGSWRSDPERVVWTSKRRESMSASESARFEEQLRAEKIARDEELATRRALAAEKAATIWAEATPAPSEHPYLTKKGVQAHGVRVSRGQIVVPVYSNGALVSLQFIDVDGGKKFLSGGKTGGCAFKIEGHADTVYVAEGFATGATLHEVTGATVYVAFNAGNLLEATSAAKDAHPGAEIVIAGDDDHNTPGNPGRAKANAAGDVMRVKVIFPEVDGDDTDFNDMARTRGVEAFKAMLMAATSLDRLQEENKRLKSKHDPFPSHCLHVDGLLGEVCDWINDSALIKQPVLTLAATLTFFAAVFGRRYRVGISKTHTNIFIVALCVSGGGKDHARKKLKELASSTGLSRLISSGDYTSGSAVKSSLVRYPIQFALPDEFGKYIKAITGKNAASHTNTIIKTWLEMYSDSGSIHCGIEYSVSMLKKGDRPDRQDIINPSLNIYGTSTPSTFFEPLASGDVTSGFLNRLLVFEGNNDATLAPETLGCDVAGSLSWMLADKVRDAYAAIPGPTAADEDMFETEPDFCNVEVSATALVILKAVIAEQEKRRLDQREPHPDLWVRLYENTVKVAAIRAIADNPLQPIIHDLHAQWASDIVLWCVANLSRRLSENLADSERERAVKAMYRYIGDGGKEGRTKSSITKTFQRLNKRDREEILEDLEQGMGVIESAQVRHGTAKKQTLIYMAVKPL